MYTLRTSYPYRYVEAVHQAYTVDDQSTFIAERDLNQGGWSIASGTIALQFVTAVTSDTVTMTIAVEITFRAGPKPTSPAIRNKDSSLKKIITHQHVIHNQRIGVQVYATCMWKSNMKFNP
jgi:hypothetical protein